MCNSVCVCLSVCVRVREVQREIDKGGEEKKRGWRLRKSEIEGEKKRERCVYVYFFVYLRLFVL